jgi:hypothetical protein
MIYSAEYNSGVGVNTASTSLVIYQFSYGPAKPTRQQYILTTAGQRNGFTPVAAKQTNITNQTAEEKNYHNTEAVTVAIKKGKFYLARCEKIKFFY